MQLEIFQVDAFSAEPFGGNPAAVIPLAALGMYVDALLAGEIETLPDRLEATVLLRELRAGRGRSSGVKQER